MADVQKLFREYVRLDRKRQKSTLSQREFERWSTLKQQLNATFSPSARPDAADRRESVRVPVKLEVHFQSSGALQRCLLTNLSRGGVFISTRSPAPIGTQIKLRIVVDEGGTEIEVPGEVVSHNVGRDFAAQGSGMGVRFVDPGPKAAVALERIYEGALSGGPKRPR
jgi:uncharacterized protein (TIGR02266 family)